jgi:hypothetical protein
VPRVAPDHLQSIDGILVVGERESMAKSERAPRVDSSEENDVTLLGDSRKLPALNERRSSNPNEAHDGPGSL